ncbi:MAG TPA: SDR family oxidoreductase [Reyranella sp.]|nr:SDR family oxidoreductase [Reyranella sp.]
MDRLFVIGLGFCGLEIARRAKANGWQVAGSVTGEGKADELRSKGIEAELLSVSSRALQAATHILSTVPPQASGDPVLPLVRELRPTWLGYISTTGVYGDRGGGWVDETDTPNPGQARSRHRLQAERAWHDLARERGAPLDVFRLPAIYGPGRSALDQVREGRAQCVDKPGQVFCRVHVADIASAVLAAMKQARGTLYNVCDDEPCAQSDVIAFACKLLGRPAPRLVPWEEAAPKMSEMARSFYAENRRVRNDRIKRELGVRLQFPTYREGLTAIASAN